MKKTNFTIVFLHCFIGAGAVVGGLGAVMNPVSPLGIPPEVLNNSPFSTYLIPGLFLLIAVGLGNIFSFLISKLFADARGYLSGFMGIIQIFWIIIQCIFLQEIGVLHVIFFVLGTAQGFLGLKIIFSLNQWPYYDVIFSIYRLQDKLKRGYR